MNPLSIRVAVDVGSTRHRVAIGLPDGKLLDEFDIDKFKGVSFALFSTPPSAPIPQLQTPVPMCSG